MWYEWRRSFFGVREALPRLLAPQLSRPLKGVSSCFSFNLKYGAVNKAKDLFVLAPYRKTIERWMRSQELHAAGSKINDFDINIFNQGRKQATTCFEQDNMRQ